jgi:hypothetical protein
MIVDYGKQRPSQGRAGQGEIVCPVYFFVENVENSNSHRFSS